MRYHTPPKLQGQSVRVSFALHPAIGIVRRKQYRREDPEFTVCPWTDYEHDQDPEPWNTVPVVKEDCYRDFETTRPITAQGWYKHKDGSYGLYVWRKHQIAVLIDLRAS